MKKSLQTKQAINKLFRYSLAVSILGLVIVAASYYAPRAKAIDMPTGGTCGSHSGFEFLNGDYMAEPDQYVCKSNGTTWRFYRLANIRNKSARVVFYYVNGRLINPANGRYLTIGGSECENADGLWLFGQEGRSMNGQYYYVNYQNNLWSWQQVKEGYESYTPHDANRITGYDLVHEYEAGRVGIPNAMKNKIIHSKNEFANLVSSNWDNIDGTIISWEGAKQLYDLAVSQGRYSASSWTTSHQWTGSSAAGLAGFCVDTSSLQATHFVGTTQVYNNGTYVESGGSVKVSDNSINTIKFVHHLSRNNDGPDGNKDVTYYINAKLDDDKVTTTKKSLPKNSNWRLVRERIIDRGNKITLNPGQEEIRWQTIHYTYTNTTTTPDTISPFVRCNIPGYEAAGRYCIRVWRPTAMFSGNVAAKIQDGNDLAVDAPNNSDTNAITIKSSDGSFKVKFQHTVKREVDDAGGTASTPWHTNITVNSIAETSKNANGASNGLATNESQIIKKYDDYVYSGNLKYGETKYICSTLNYARIVNQKDGNTNDTKTKCVKLYREKAECGIDQSYRYGVSDGRNIGRIGVVNRTLAGSDSFQFTNYAPSSFSPSNNYTNTVSIWARPGDSIRFRYEACAGASYAVHNTSTLNNDTYKTTYTANGSSSIGGRTGYLFGDSVPTTISTSPLKYSDSRTWNSFTATSGFLHQDNAELTAQSPSNTSKSTYEQDTYNKNSYKCVNLPNGPSYTDQHYQIAGRNNTSSCNSSSKTTNDGNDVGSTITQSFTWNDLNIANGTVTNTPHDLTGKAMVHIPYNYILKPYAKRGTSTTTNVVYGGSEFTVKTGIYIQPRTNTSISDDATQNKYATITKPTRVKVERYYTTFDGSGNISNAETDLTTISDTSNVLFNATGDYRGNTSGDGEVYPNSNGTTVYVPDNRPTGSLVCLKLSVWPSDSHNNISLTSGAGSQNIALTSAAEVPGGTTANWAVARACYTVAKRPTTSFEGSNALAGSVSGGFKTSRYTKAFSVGSAKYIFGSWSEYALIGRNDVSGVRGTASGATLGYKVGASNVAINDTRANDDTSKAATVSNSDNVCVFGSQMFANNYDCSSTGVLGGQITSASDMAKNFANNMRSHFTANEPNKTINVGTLSACNYVDNAGDAKCVKNNNGTKYARITSNNDAIAYTTDSDTVYNRINGNAYIDGDLVAKEQTNVYEVQGTLVIGGNILTTDSGTDPTYSNAGGIKQNIILANNVLIMPNVTKIDAVIVANDLVDTCAYENTSKWRNGTRVKIDNLNSEICTEQLIFEAPVITKAINLHRTYGATSETNSIRRAEIFNFNMANYLWAFKQSGKYSQANTTHTRELPPRY